MLAENHEVVASGCKPKSLGERARDHLLVVLSASRLDCELTRLLYPSGGPVILVVIEDNRPLASRTV